MMSIVPVILVLQTNYRRKHKHVQFQLFKKNIITLQRFFRKIMRKEFILPKTQYKVMKKIYLKNKYFTVFVNIEQLVIDIQKNVRRFLVRKENEMQPTLGYTCHDDLVSTEYSSSDEENEENILLDPRLHNIEVLLTKFFSKYNPSKIPNIPAVVEFINGGNKSFESIQTSLMKKYNANLNDIMD